MIPFVKPNKPDMALFNKLLEDSIEANHYTNFGINHNKLKAKFQEMTGIQDIVLACNATVILDGLHALLAEDCDIAYLPSFTFPATNQGCHSSIERRYSETIGTGDHIGRPKWDDYNKSDYSAYAVTVNPFGSFTAPIERPDSMEYWVVDNAAGLLAQAKDWIAEGADAVVYSLHATKILSACEGGVVFFNNKDMYNKYTKYINFGIEFREDGTRKSGHRGSNHKMSELSAAWCLMNLERYDEDIGQREKVAKTYSDFCTQNKIPHIKSVQSFWLLGNVSNIAIQKTAKLDHAIEVKPYYEKLRLTYRDPVTTLFNDNGFCLPTYPHEDISKVLKMLEDFKAKDLI